ncbi:MAG TPA: response regulator [Acidimicrobiales bacterium]|nr:response regulator [Acidimicrobiales bacterium]
MTATHRAVRILLVEDSPGDVRLTREALQRSKVANQLVVAGDADLALDALHGRGEYDGTPPPDLVLLDLNLPGRSGHEVLEAIRLDAVLSAIPVVILTTSKAEEDILRAYNLHANCYVVKPVDFRALVEIVGKIEAFWLQVVELPRDVSEPVT